ncbi:Down syndrome cell adhesion molecule-like protein Dscam2 isoform X2 [Tetranychus urticae]|uniref:Down syndrome cell adhesion molecule-like protein Dscam2 isoform X2 n=1 Tax=Tetranychus urticae TaxID=32264 RepID=UPI00077B851C|nr:Down syndrome cell adhesion molecule-like protein Dscam2 isoform X2 [Tetranychus urticae]
MANLTTNLTLTLSLITLVNLISQGYSVNDVRQQLIKPANSTELSSKCPNCSNDTNSSNNFHKRTKRASKDLNRRGSFWVKMRPERLIVGRQGSTVIIDCFVNDDINFNLDTVDITWLKDSKPLLFDSRIQLVKSNRLKIVSLTRQDKGVYQCLATYSPSPSPSSSSSSLSSANPLTASDYVEIILHDEAPTIREKFYSQSLNPGSPVSLKCSSTGSPLPKIRWYHYAKPLSHTSYRNKKRVSHFENGSDLFISWLNITSIDPEDGGLYTCEAFNEIGIARSSASIQVTGPPFVHPMDNITLGSQESLTIHCPYSGYPIESITWTKGRDFVASRGVKSHPNGTLTLVDAHSEDEGWFKCEVRNKEGQTASGSLYIDIIEKPSINPFIFGSDLREGMRTTVVCSIGLGEPPFRITWLKDGIPIDHGNPDLRVEALGDFTSSLKITDIRRKHSGNYTCKAASARAPDIYSTFTAQLIVQAAPKWILKPLERYSTIRGSKVLMNCQAEGIPPPVYQWKKARRLESSASNELIGIVSGPHIHVLENGSLAIIDSTKADEGDYVCEVTNNKGPSLTSISRLEVHDPVHFTKSYELVKVEAGLKAEIICDPLGDQPIEINWNRVASSPTVASPSSLPVTLTNDDRRLAGILGINGVNGMKIGRELIPSSSHHSFLSSSRFQINQDVNGNRVISHVTLDSPLVEDSGTFICTASNSYGKAEKTVHLIVQGPPRSPRNLRSVEVASRDITIAWEAPDDGNSPILDYLIQYTYNNGIWTNSFETTSVNPKECTALISGLLPETIYRIRVLAQNTFGRSEPSDEITVRTEEEAPGEAPNNVRVESISSQTLKIIWNNIGKTRKIEGYHIGYRQVHGFNSMRDTFNFKSMSLNETLRQFDELQYQLSDLKRNTKYGLVIRPYNKKGPGVTSEEVFAQTLEFDPPGEIHVRINVVTHRSLTVEIIEQDEVNPISGYIVNYKTNAEDWEEVKILGHRKNFVLEDLRCGTKYTVSISAFNKAGPSLESQLLDISTSGHVPSPGSLESLLTVNSTSALIDLSAWSENGCPILSFVVQYKLHFQTDWIMFSNNIMPSQSKLIIPDLIPATWYDLLMIANSEPGTTEAQYLFATLTPTGGTIPPISSNTYSNWELNLGDPVVLAPILCAFIVFIVIFITIAILMSTKHQRTGNSQETYNTNDRQKMESLSMSSFALPVESSIDGKKIYETVQRKSGYGSYYTSPYAANRLAFCEQEASLTSNLHQIQRHPRMDPDPPYDVLLTRNFRPNSPG